jgi:hypothetical protein
MDKHSHALGQKRLKTLAMLSIQHDLSRVQNNWKFGTGKCQTSEFKTTWNLEKTSSDWEKNVLNSHPTRNSKSGTPASF